MPSLGCRNFYDVNTWQGHYVLGQPPQAKLDCVPGGTLQAVYSRHTCVGSEVEAAPGYGMQV